MGFSFSDNRACLVGKCGSCSVDRMLSICPLEESSQNLVS
jgi:hypothetical protein